MTSNDIAEARFHLNQAIYADESEAYLGHAWFWEALGGASYCLFWRRG